MGALIPPKTLPQLGGQPGRQLVATRCGLNGTGGVYDKSSPGVLNRIRHVLPYEVHDLVFVYAGFYMTNDGNAVETPLKPYAGFQAVSVVAAAGGSSHAVGDILTANVASHQTSPKIIVNTVSTGSITSCSIIEGGAFDTQPAAALAQASTTGSGTGATFTFTCNVYSTYLNAGVEQSFGTQAMYQPGVYNGVLALTNGANYSGRNRSIFIPSGDSLVTDPVTVELPAGTAIGERTWTSGGNIPVGRFLNETGNSEYVGAGAAAQNYAVSNNAYPTDTNNAAAGMQPIAILGRVKIPAPSFVAIGDSISYGSTGGGNYDSPGDASGNMGWIERGIADSRPFSNMSTVGDSCAFWINGAGLTNSALRLREIERIRPSHIIDCLAINDFVGGGLTYAAFLANKIVLWNFLLGMGIKEIWLPTCTVKTTGTFATQGGQTITASNTAVQQWNTALRAGLMQPYGVTTILDLGATVETTIGAGKWPNSTTIDGVHPLAATHAAMATQTAPTFATATI